MKDNLAQYEIKHFKLVRKNAAECTVLLKKDSSFPIKEPCKIAAFGAGIRHTVKGGTGSGEVNSHFSTNIEEGLTEAGFEITSTKWLDAYDEVLKASKKEFVKVIKAEAKAKKVNTLLYAMGKTMPEPEYELALEGKGNTAIYVVSRNSGEGDDRKPQKGDILLTDTEIRDILKLNKKYDKFMLVLNVGGVVDLSPVVEVKNILILSQLGVVTGNVLADILLGKSYPSGKLATTWAEWEDYPKIGEFGDINETRYKEGIYVGYRYFDSLGVKPLFPFGHGLGYTDFKLSDLSISNIQDKISVKVKVSNIGEYKGKEVVQVYVSAPTEKLDKPYQELAAWTKTKELDLNQEEVVNVTFRLSDMASYDENIQSYVVEKGDYKILVGNSSRDTQLVACINVSETVSILQVKNCLGKPDFKDYIPENLHDNVGSQSVDIYLTPSDFNVSEVSYNRDYDISPKVENLSDEELVNLCIGAFDPNAGAMSVIGSSGQNVAGAAGETTSILKDKGFNVLVMADGPAGVRIARDYYEDKKGLHALGNTMFPESMFEFMSGFQKFLMNVLLKPNKVPKNVTVNHQYATAIPIGTAIAQSFNNSLVTELGDMIGQEMAMFGVNLWLAPAMNIHRSILCGRNFEYYSEDPRVSGEIAAAMTIGVQNHKGCGVTIKHFAVNNQETNRYANNSQVSERALREIYLRGFGICVEKSNPAAVMTSYNLLNGTHTAEHKGLIEDVLRAEYGFEGIVMTDWVIQNTIDEKSIHRNSLANEVAKAGGDLFMPGCKFDYDCMINGINDGSLSRKQLIIAGSRILHMIERMGK